MKDFNLDKFKNLIFNFQLYSNDDTIFILKEKMGTRIFDNVYERIGLVPNRIKITFSNDGNIYTSSLHYSNKPKNETFSEFVGSKKVILLIKDPIQRLASGIYESYMHGGSSYQLYYSSLNHDDNFYITRVIYKQSSNEVLTENELSSIKKYIKSILSFCLIDYYPISDNHFQKYHKPLKDLFEQKNITLSETYTTDEFFTDDIANNKFLFNYNFNDKSKSWIGKKNIVIESLRELISESESFSETYNTYMDDEKSSYTYFLKLNG